MWESGFFNSLNGDRKYNAEQLSEIFTGLISDGVYESVGGKLAVQPYSGMTIQIASGRGWFNGHWVNNSSEYYLDLEPADVTLNRYAAVVIRVDESDAVRNVTPYVKYSDFASSPIKPYMERTETVREYCLAYIYISAKASTITASYIEDCRGDANVCGWVTGLIDQVDTNTLYAQWESLFFDWFDNIQHYMDEDVETKLVADMVALKEQVENGGSTAKLTKTLYADWWIDNEIMLDLRDITANSDIIVSPANYDVPREAYISCGVEAVAVGDQYIQFKCDEQPTVNIEIEIIVLNF